jgi:hypothetical protein
MHDILQQCLATLCNREMTDIQTHTNIIIEPRHDKTNIMRLRPARIQTSLRIGADCLGSMLFAYKTYNK